MTNSKRYTNTHRPKLRVRRPAGLYRERGPVFSFSIEDLDTVVTARFKELLQEANNRRPF